MIPRGGRAERWRGSILSQLIVPVRGRNQYQKCAMKLNWQPYPYDAASRRDGLIPLFRAGVQRGLPASALCKMAADIASLSPHDDAQISELAEGLVAAAPESPQAWSFRAQSLRMFGQREEALKACETGLAIDPDSPDLLLQKANALMGADQYDAAFAVLKRLGQIAPGLASAPLCECLIKLNRIDEAAALLMARRKEGPLPTSLLTFAYVCDLLSDRPAQSDLRDGALIAQVDDAASLAGHDRVELNDALAQAIQTSPAMRREPANTATVAGQQGFLNEVLPQIEAERVIAMIRANIEAYVHDRAGHDYVQRAPEALTITSWAVSLAGGGHQAAHTHPAGWLSGVYYVDVGDAQTGAENAGAIEFWGPPEHLTNGRDVDGQILQPNNGMMLVFPSYAYHRTIPHAGDRSRLSIAFDIG